MIIKRLKSILTMGLAVAALSVVGTNVHAQEQLGNGGFESPILGDQPATTGNFSAFSQDPANALIPLPTNSDENPLNGTQSVITQILGVDGSFVGIQQNVADIIVGETYTYTINARTDGNPLGLSAEYRIEYLDDAGGFVVDQFANNIAITDGLSDTYASFTQSSVAPAGATTARAVFALQSFGGGDNNGTVFLDDISLTGAVAAIPEPSSMGLMVAGLVGLVARRRRS